jgi:hypothetical protein
VKKPGQVSDPVQQKTEKQKIVGISQYVNNTIYIIDSSIIMGFACFAVSAT